ncbi:uncharacterized protein LOC135160420 [Diachasmimorpha longicaudata]|uniref:uncharacterized protein LOC135160420 n=1 Tax=Diachasmimorpha longicaudata TaxID=58733 RepID=UPI0030B912B4
MALSRLGCSKELPVILTRLNPGVNVLPGSGKSRPLDFRYKDLQGPANFHLSGARQYPEAPTLPLPGNLAEIFNNETGRFAPERVRDITTPMMLYGSNNSKTWDKSWMSTTSAFGDSHVDSYDCFGTISLNGTMQTNVPHPCKSTARGTHMNMPGGQWVQSGKYIAEYMQKNHYDFIKKNFRSIKPGDNGFIIKVCYSTSAAESSKISENDTHKNKLTNADKLKRAVKDYGSTVIVFHVGISLLSLGAFYALVSSGLDLTSLVKLIPNSSERLETIMTGSSTFLVAYAVHKVFAPVRISITLASTPFIVRYLRRIGILKMRKT